MYRGTTPTLKVQIKGVDLSDFSGIYITIKQKNTEITKQGYEIVVENDVIYAPLTQEDTLKLNRGYAYVQMRAITLEGVAVASDVKMVLVNEILKDGVIT